MSRYTRKMKGGKRATRIAAKKKNATASSKNRSMSSVPAIDIKSDADVKKALSAMNKHPLTVILVFAVWCPHCHTFMEQWNKYKKLPNRKSPMISCEQTFMNKLLPHIQTKEGTPLNVEGFPTVLTTMNKNATGVTKNSSEPGQNVGEIIQDPRNEAAMSELLSNSANTVTTETLGSEEPLASVNNEISEENASTFSNSLRSLPRTNTPYPRETRGAMKTRKVSREVAAAIKSASNAAKSASNSVKSLRDIGSEELNGSFATHPVGEGQRGGSCSTGPSGLCTLTGGASRANSLLSQLGSYIANN